MVNTNQLKNILFLDIETVPEERSFAELNTVKQDLYAQKTQYQRKEDFTTEEFYNRAGIWAEFGKIVCISVGFFDGNDDDLTFRLKSFYDHDEIKILEDFKAILETYFNEKQHVLCAHNGKEFDFPYIARRMIINKIELPEKLNLFGKKPWEVAHLDTLEMWKFGDYKHYTSLNLLTNILGIPSPKGDIDGSQVAKVFYEEKDLERIAVYCEKDTLAVAQVYLRFMNLDILKDKQVVRVSS
ncbi:MAG: 3'-5' exonuclease [Flavobacteriaceae bacterium]|nr:3'-5' exonuclease [Flavobacteriaceae bacterium]